jgi:hypothetical protein
MAGNELVRRRLVAQRLIGPPLAAPADVVAWFGAVQAQDYRGALWGIAQRTTGATEADVERALAERTIVRTWPMRGTLHFVAAADVRWMTRLLAPRIIARAATRHRALELDAKTFARSRQLLARALHDTQLDRAAVYAVLARGGVSPAGQRGIHILVQLAMEGMLCYGAPRGKQQTFALLDDWIPSSRGVLEGDEALGELARRYLTSHGPATVHDLAWWSGLNLSEARRAIELAAPDVVERDGHWRAAALPALPRTAARAHLLPAYDEYTVAYRDRSAILDPAMAARTRNGIFSPVVVLDGAIAGTWRRTLQRDRLTVTAELLAAATPAVRRALEAAVARYGRFHGVTAASLALASSSSSRTSAGTSGSARRGRRRGRRRHPRSSSRSGGR